MSDMMGVVAGAAASDRKISGMLAGSIGAIGSKSLRRWDNKKRADRGSSRRSIRCAVARLEWSTERRFRRSSNVKAWLARDRYK
jgi:hypothetical protein